MKPKDSEIYNQIDAAKDAIENGGKYFGMTYEDGVKAALEWILTGQDKPMEDE